jgi:hypothetical protein
MKRVPEPHPPWLDLCPIEDSSGSVIDFPVVQDLLPLLWVVGPWSGRQECSIFVRVPSRSGLLTKRL